MRVFILLLLSGLILNSCREPLVPKPKAYPRIEFPAHAYQLWNGECPFTFEIPVYSEVIQDSVRDAEPCWKNVHFLPFGAILHLSYKSINGDPDVLFRLSEDSREMVYKHTQKADDIIPSLIQSENRVYGLWYDLEGSTASAMQFYVTDSSSHFLRGALYFDCHINKDSLAPIIDFLKEDVKHIVQTIRWKT